MTKKLMDMKQTASNGFPDPDMAVVFGSSTVMSGFQPWQTRLTEFLFATMKNTDRTKKATNTDKLIDINSFVGDVRYFGWAEYAATYEKYAHRNKRFGK